VRLSPISAKMNRQPACELREVGEGISGGGGACWTGSKVCQQSGGWWWWAAKWWQQAAFSKHQRGGGGIDVQRKGGEIFGEELISALKSIIVLIILRCVASLSTLPSHCSRRSRCPPSSLPPPRPLPNLSQDPILR
jgi:hypothetical protein